MNTLILSALLAVANVLGVGMIVPQVKKLGGNNSSTNGVSGAWVGVGIGLNGWWIAYATETGLWGLLPVSLGAAALYLVMAYRLFRHRGQAAIRSIALGLVLLGLLPAPFLILNGWTAAGLAIGASYGLQFVPAAVVAVRSADVSGVSATTWIMALIEAAIWWGYGVYSDDRALVVGGAGATVASLVILIRLLSDTWGTRLRVGQTRTTSTAAV